MLKKCNSKILNLGCFEVNLISNYVSESTTIEIGQPQNQLANIIEIIERLTPIINKNNNTRKIKNKINKLKLRSKSKSQKT